jgi:hypothetical protein
MEVQDSEIEWAVIARLRHILDASSEREFEVTEAFAAFSSIVCWIAQRMRPKGTSPMDNAARRFYSAMDKRSLHDAPGAPKYVSDITVAIAIVEFRDALAHADAQNVRPLNHREPGRPPRLIGFEFRGKRGPIHLTADQMVKFGTWIADAFMTAISARPDGRPNLPHFREVVGAIREIRA